MSSSRPPPQAVELRHWSLRGGGELGRLRASLSRSIDDQHGEISERVALVATELATNALQHGLPPTTVRLLRFGDRFFLDVADSYPDGVPHAVAASLSDDRGRGMAIARSMSLQVGWYITAETKHVWASFPVALSGS